MTKEDFEKLRTHCWNQHEAPGLDNVEMVFMVADTQDNRSVVGIFALDVMDNIYLLDAKEVQHLLLNEDERKKINELRKLEAEKSGKKYEPVITAEDMLKKQYLVKDGVGIVPTFALIDRQGHRSSEVQYFATEMPNVMMYQGTALTTSNWKLSDNNRKLLLAAAKQWQSKLIYQLYTQKKRGSNYLYFYPDIEDEVIKQIVCVKPDSSKKFGDAPENWIPENGAQHDWFDVIKMAYLAVDFAIQTMAKKRWRFCQSPNLYKRWKKQISSENAVKQEVQETEEQKKWFTS